MNNYRKNFMGPGHPPRQRTPQNNEMLLTGHGHIGHVRTVRPMHRFPRFSFLHNGPGPDFRPRRSFGGSFQPYRNDKPWNPVGIPGPRRQFPLPVLMPMQMGCNDPQFHEGRYERRRHLVSNQENAEPYHPQYVLRTSVDPRGGENYHNHGHVAKHYTEVCASVNFTIGTSSYELKRGVIIQKETKRKRVSLNEDLEQRDLGKVQVVGGNGTCTSAESSDDTVAVEPDLCISPETSTTSEDEVVTKHGKYFEHIEEYDDSTNQASSQEEEYEPEHPDIATDTLLTHNLYVTGLPIISIDNDTLQEMASCDDEGFHEAFVGVCISRYPSLLGRMLEVAGFGIWFSDGHKSNFSGVLQPDRPQNVKAVMIHGSARSVEAMKKEGYSRIRINLETDYLNENVLGWISKYMENPTAKPANWDEVKYRPEILELCNSANGMIIKWSHICDTSLKRTGIEKAKLLAIKATDTWMKERLYLQEAVGTTQ